MSRDPYDPTIHIANSLDDISATISAWGGRRPIVIRSTVRRTNEEMQEIRNRAITLGWPVLVLDENWDVH